MFGLLVSGRLVDTSFRQVDATHCVIDIADVNAFNHIVVFLTGQQAFPDGTGGGVYFSWPETEGNSNCWHYLGMISNQKPSAIFKVVKPKPNDSRFQLDMSTRFMQQATPMAQVGVSIETEQTLLGLEQSSGGSEPAVLVPKFVEFSQKMVQSLFNYTTSFAIDAGQARLRTSETFVPFSAVQQWYANFERKLQMDPYFWTKQ